MCTLSSGWIILKCGVDDEEPRCDDNKSDELIVLMGLGSSMIRIVSEATCRFFSVRRIARFINNLKMSLVIKNRNLIVKMMVSS